jgi:hypothetical protein
VNWFTIVVFLRQHSAAPRNASREQWTRERHAEYWRRDPPNRAVPARAERHTADNDTIRRQRYNSASDCTHIACTQCVPRRKVSFPPDGFPPPCRATFDFFLSQRSARCLAISEARPCAPQKDAPGKEKCVSRQSGREQQQKRSNDGRRDQIYALHWRIRHGSRRHGNRSRAHPRPG